MTNIYYLLAQVLQEGEVDIPKTSLTQDSVSTVLSLLFAIAGGIAFIIIIIGGIQYVLSQGEPQAINKAKNTILYALIGLIVCVLAFSIVGFTIGSL